MTREEWEAWKSMQGPWWDTAASVVLLALATAFLGANVLAVYHLVFNLIF